jgi:hypothetical protein
MKTSNKRKVSESSAGITLNSGRRFHVKGNAIHGYYVEDHGTKDPSHPVVVFESENAQDCYTYREEQHGSYKP